MIMTNKINDFYDVDTVNLEIRCVECDILTLIIVRDIESLLKEVASENLGYKKRNNENLL